MNIVSITPDNIADEHICCAFADKKCAAGYQAKKDWLTARYAEGYRFKRMDARGKALIEYGPAEKAFAPVDAPGYAFINCFWVSGSLKGQGYASRLFAAAAEDTSGAAGLVAISSHKKRPFLSDKKFFLHQGFEVVDTAPPFYELLVKKNNPESPSPVFAPEARRNRLEGERSGVDVFYSHRCPFSDYYIEQELSHILKNEGIPYRFHLLDTQEKAFRSPCASTVVSIFYKGVFVTHEFTTKKRFPKLKEKFRIIDEGGIPQY